MVKKYSEGDSPSYLLDEKATKKFVRQMLKNHTFVGNFVEKRYVPQFDCYKKIIKISNDEDIFIENLTIAKSRINKFFGATKWVGITFPNTLGTPVGYNLWVDIKEDIFGSYVFCVKDVQFTEDHISLKLRVVEPYNEKSSMSSQSFQDNNCTGVEKDGEEVFTWTNIKEAFFFLFLLSVAIVTGGGQIIIFLMDYLLKLLREFSNVIKVLTPFLIACLETSSKIFGYICFLLALLWRDIHGPQKPVVAHPRIHYNKSASTAIRYYQPVFPYETRYKALSYNKKSSVEITELSD